MGGQTEWIRFFLKVLLRAVNAHFVVLCLVLTITEEFFLFKYFIKNIFFFYL